MTTLTVTACSLFSGGHMTFRLYFDCLVYFNLTVLWLTCNPAMIGGLEKGWVDRLLN